MKKRAHTGDLLKQFMIALKGQRTGRSVGEGLAGQPLIAEGRRRQALFHKHPAFTLDKKRWNGESGLSTRPLEPARADLQQSQRCPQCGSGSTRHYRDGIRHLTDNKPIQRWLCRDCGYRFSEDSGNGFSRAMKNVENIYRNPVTDVTRQVCESLTRGSKNLNSATEIKTVAGDIRKTDPKTTKGLLLQYALWLEKEGYAKDCRYVGCIRMLINSGADLYNPEHVKETIGAKRQWKDGTKMQVAYAYDAMTKMLNLSWRMPKYIQEETLPFIPEEGELDQLIAACKSRRMAAFLQTLKETFADPGEALRLRWIDVSGNVITINQPVKGHRPRQLQVSNKLLAMLNCLPKTSDRIFPCKYETLATCFMRIRKSVAQIQQNPRLLKISFVTFRHWGGTMIAHYTHGNVLTVQKLLGHKNIRNTMKYIGLINFKDDEFEVVTATTVEEAKQVLSGGFDYVTEKNGIMLFRRPKRFGT